jgi:hypothetical protein
VCRIRYDVEHTSYLLLATTTSFSYTWVPVSLSAMRSHIGTPKIANVVLEMTDHISTPSLVSQIRPKRSGRLGKFSEASKRGLTAPCLLSVLKNYSQGASPPPLPQEPTVAFLLTSMGNLPDLKVGRAFSARARARPEWLRREENKAVHKIQ